jgi:hypothetical protein
MIKKIKYQNSKHKTCFTARGMNENVSARVQAPRTKYTVNSLSRDEAEIGGIERSR